ncbi:MAG: hypothetical protein GY772_21460, partial [bacterium]|nr:hypothetical protein [bacterium]
MRALTSTLKWLGSKMPEPRADQIATLTEVPARAIDPEYFLLPQASTAGTVATPSGPPSGDDVDRFITPVGAIGSVPPGGSADAPKLANVGVPLPASPVGVSSEPSPVEEAVCALPEAGKGVDLDPCRFAVAVETSPHAGGEPERADASTQTSPRSTGVTDTPGDAVPPWTQRRAKRRSEPMLEHRLVRARRMVDILNVDADDVVLERELRTIPSPLGDVVASGPCAARDTDQWYQEGVTAGDVHDLPPQAGTPCFDLTVDQNVPVVFAPSAEPSSDAASTAVGAGAEAVSQAPSAAVAASSDAAAGGGQGHLGSCGDGGLTTAAAAEGTGSNAGARDADARMPSATDRSASGRMQSHCGQASPDALNRATIEQFVINEMRSLRVALPDDVRCQLVAAIFCQDASSQASVVIPGVATQLAIFWRGYIVASNHLTSASRLGPLSRATADPLLQLGVANAQIEGPA